MWDDARQLNAIAVTLAVIAIAFLCWAIAGWVTRLAAFDYREVVVTAPLARASGAHLEAVIRGELRGTFFTMDLDAARASLRRVPWVRSVALRRQWPHRLEVEIDEHQPLALERRRAGEHARRGVRRQFRRRPAAIHRSGWPVVADGRTLSRVGSLLARLRCNCAA